MIIHLPKHIEGTASRVNHNVNYILRVAMMPRRFINDNKPTTVVRDVDKKGGCANVGRVGI